MAKVAVITDTWFPYLGGGQINTWEISKRLAKKGHKIDIITQNCGYEDLKRPKNIQVIKLGYSKSPASTTARLFFLIKAFFYVYKRKYDIAHGHAFLSGLTLGLLKIIKGVPTIFTVHGTSLGTSLNNPLKQFIEWAILTRIPYTAQITVSQDFKKIGNINKHVEYIPNGVDAKKFDAVQLKKPEKPALIFVGRLHPQKNLKNLIKAILIAKKQIPEIKLRIVGDGQDKESLLKLTKDLSLKNNIEFLGQVNDTDLIRLYKSSSIFILPSFYEGLPLSLLEAWAAKIPAIVTKTGQCQFLVKEGKNGFLIKNPQEATDISKTIVKALKYKNLEHLGKNGYNLVAKNFSWDQSAQKTSNLYESVAKAHN